MNLLYAKVFTMAIQRLKLAGKRFVVMPEAEYQKFAARAAPRNGSRRKPRRMTRQDRGDVAEAARRGRERSIPLPALKAELGTEKVSGTCQEPLSDSRH